MRGRDSKWIDNPQPSGPRNATVKAAYLYICGKILASLWDAQLIALFTVTFSHLHYNVFEHGCEAVSGNFALLARNCLTSTFKNIVMQMRKVNCEKGYWRA